VDVLRALGHASTGWIAANPGLSGARVWRGAVEGGSVALKRFPPHSIDASRLREVERVIDVAARAGVPGLPTPALAGVCATHRAKADDGAWWECTRWLDGEPVTMASAPAAFAALAELHGAWRGAGVHEGIAPAAQARREALVAATRSTRFQRPRDPQTAESLAALRDAAEPLKHDSLEAIHRVLELRLPLQQVHGDLRPEHTLVSRRTEQGDAPSWCVTGWIDFTATRIDTPLVDAARLAGELAGGDRRLRDEVVCSAALGVTPDLACEVVGALDLAGAVVAAYRWVDWCAEECFTGDALLLALARVRSLTEKLRCLAG
jgi:hypothetical protein